MTRFALATLAVTALIGAGVATVSSAQVSLRNQPLAADYRNAAAAQNYTPRVPKKARRLSRRTCESLYRCCVQSWGKQVTCCDLYNNDQACPY